MKLYHCISTVAPLERAVLLSPALERDNTPDALVGHNALFARYRVWRENGSDEHNAQMERFETNSCVILYDTEMGAWERSDAPWYRRILLACDLRGTAYEALAPSHGERPLISETSERRIVPLELPLTKTLKTIYVPPDDVLYAAVTQAVLKRRQEPMTSTIVRFSVGVDKIFPTYTPESLKKGLP